MLVAIIGGTAHDRKEALQKFLGKKYPKTAFLFSLYESIPQEGELLTRAHQSQGFFSERTVVFLKDIGEDLLGTLSAKTLDTLAASETPFAFLDASLTKGALRELEARSAIITEIADAPKKQSSYRQNIFAICDAFSTRNRFLVWKELETSFARADAPEAVAGMIFSRIRTMLRDKNYGKYSRSELEQLSSSLAFCIPSARAQGEDSAFALEKWALTLPE